MDIVANIRITMETMASIRRHWEIVLIIKSHRGERADIRSHGGSGAVDIVTCIRRHVLDLWSHAESRLTSGDTTCTISRKETLKTTSEIIGTCAILLRHSAAAQHSYRMTHPEMLRCWVMAPASPPSSMSPVLRLLARTYSSSLQTLTTAFSLSWRFLM